MRKKTFERMKKRVRDLNESPLSTPIKIMRLLPNAQQPNYNPKLREWFGPKKYETVAETTGIVDAYKESEEWREIGMLGLHDYKATINDNLNLNFHDITLYMAQLDNDESKMYNIVFYREFIGEVHIGLRPLVS